MIRVVLVDDQALVRAGLERILGTEDDLTIVAECADGAQAIDAVEAHHPDVVVMDIRMRVMNGIEATRKIRDAGGPPVLMLTTFDDDEALWGAIDAGAAGFVLKDALGRGSHPGGAYRRQRRRVARPAGHRTRARDLPHDRAPAGT